MATISIEELGLLSFGTPNTWHIICKDTCSQGAYLGSLPPYVHPPFVQGMTNQNSKGTPTSG